ncbi:MAG: peptidylprolyl isomerase, partial [Actinomycetota bacterium]|nr:peptidylprolyl isomerase [Actinomycetota bacterium]
PTPYIGSETIMLKRHLTSIAVAIALVTAACSSSSTASVDEGAARAPETTAAAVEVEQTDDTGGAFMVQDGDLVEVHYDGTLDDGSTFDSSRERETPFSFEVGTGQVIPGFDEAVRGLKIGESREVRIPPAEAYGNRSDENIVEVPYGPDQSDVAVGDQVYLNTGQSAIVLEVKKDTVVLDANHELAGQALTFNIEVLSITRP